jgi:hypothetical protein
MLAVVSAPFLKKVPQHFSIDRVIRLLQIDEQVILPLPPAMNFVEEATGVDGGLFTLFKPSLVYLRFDEVWAALSHLREYCFLHNF